MCIHWADWPPAGKLLYKKHPMLQNQPTEILEAIIDHLPSKKDRISFSGVSKRFRELLSSRFFKTLTIRAKEHDLLGLDARPYASLEARKPLGGFKLVKHLHLKAPFHRKLGDARCPHTQLSGPLPPDQVTGRRLYGSHARLLKLIPLLYQLQENGLVSFSWDLGMCVPEHILGREGYLAKKQTVIESLSLITGGKHYYKREDYALPNVVLSNSPQLRTCSWKGLYSTEELESLRGLFASNYQILEDLELDFIDWERVCMDGRAATGGRWPFPSFTRLILPHCSDRDVKVFASLRRLALREFAFEEKAQGIIQAFNISHLRSLKLHNCTGILTFLSTIVKAELVLKLKSLEIITQDDAHEYDGLLHSPLISFLEHFDGLENLYLMLRVEKLRPEHWPACYWNAILHHSSTLKKLVYHERTTTLVTHDP